MNKSEILASYGIDKFYTRFETIEYFVKWVNPITQEVLVIFQSSKLEEVLTFLYDEMNKQ